MHLDPTRSSPLAVRVGCVRPYAVPVSGNDSPTYIPTPESGVVTKVSPESWGAPGRAAKLCTPAPRLMTLASLSDFGEAPVHRKGLAGDVVGGMRQKEDGGGGDVPAGSLPAERDRGAVPVWFDEARQTPQ